LKYLGVSTYFSFLSFPKFILNKMRAFGLFISV